MKIEDSVALVTGANRGLGRAIAVELRERGARKVYAAARRPEEITIPGVIPVRLDVTNPQEIAEAVSISGDVTLLVNNAGISTFGKALDAPLEDVRAEMETNYFGPLQVTRAFVPQMRANGGGALLNVSSVMAWLGLEHSSTYGASKAALWALSNGLRVELAASGITVTSLFLASTDTDMMADFDVPKNRAEDVARVAIDGVRDRLFEVLADETSRGLKSAIGQDLSGLYPDLHPAGPTS